MMLSVICAGVWGLARAAQPVYPPVLFGDTTTMQLYMATIGCADVWAVCRRESRFLLDSLYSLPVAEWSPDGDYIAVHLGDGWVVYPRDCLLVLQTCQPAPLPAAAGDTRIAWGAGGEIIATFANTSVATSTLYTRGCWDGSDTCLQKSVLLSSTALLTEPAWSADSTRMAYVDYLQTGLIWFYTGCFDFPEGCGDELNVVNTGTRVVWPSLSHDGRSAIFTMDLRGANTYQQLFHLNIDTGELQQLTDRAGTAIYPDWSADERYILFSGFPTLHSGDLQIYLMDLQRGITLPVIHHFAQDVVFASWGYPAAD
ncbi:MAG: hypothetical protein LCI00_27600 [Chloroflexi bacterium]|nr:hypothetical protein [Chloroflexota bacterium]MCC6897256.1 PD40 domain-containing protein [Anaerolineae bacterium]